MTDCPNQCCGAGTFWPMPVWGAGIRLQLRWKRKKFWTLFSFIVTLIKFKFKKKILTNKWIFFEVRSMGVVKICKNKSLKPYFFIGAEAGPGKKNNPEPEKTDRLRSSGPNQTAIEEDCSQRSCLPMKKKVENLKKKINLSTKCILVRSLNRWKKIGE